MYIYYFYSKYIQEIETRSPELYEGDAGLPVFSRLTSQRKHLFTIQDVATCILHPKHNPAYFCRKVPTHVNSNVSFLVDTNQFDDPGDIDSDDMGVWRNNRVDSVHITVQADSRAVTSVKKCMKSSKRGVFLLKRVYRIHGTDSSLRKITSTIYGMYVCMECRVAFIILC